MIINDQNAHGIGSGWPRQSRYCIASGCTRAGATSAATGHASRSRLRYAPIRTSGHLSVNVPFGEERNATRSGAKLMWQKLSLRARINVLLALVLALGLLINIGRLVLEAGPRVQAEDQSVIRLAREFIETIVAGLNEAPDPDARLNQIVHD